MHTNPATQRVDMGSRKKSTLAQRCRDQPGELKHVHKPRDAEEELGNWESSAHSPATQRVSIEA